MNLKLDKKRKEVTGYVVPIEKATEKNEYLGKGK